MCFVCCCFCSSFSLILYIYFFATRSCFYAMLRFILCSFLITYTRKTDQSTKKRNLLSAKDTNKIFNVRSLYGRALINERYVYEKPHQVSHLWFLLHALQQIKWFLFIYLKFKLHNYPGSSMKSHSEHWKGARTHSLRKTRLWSCLSRSPYYFFFFPYDGENSFNRLNHNIHEQMHWIECMKQVPYLCSICKH